MAFLFISSHTHMSHPTHAIIMFFINFFFCVNDMMNMQNTRSRLFLNIEGIFIWIFLVAKCEKSSDDFRSGFGCLICKCTLMSFAGLSKVDFNLLSDHFRALKYPLDSWPQTLPKSFPKGKRVSEAFMISNVQLCDFNRYWCRWCK